MKPIPVVLLACAVAALATAGPMGSTAVKPQTAVFAGGCFWSLESAFEKTYGVIDAVSGYAGRAGASGANPGYESYAEKGYIESVRVTFDPSRVSYAGLLDVYWRATDPTDGGGQFADRGPEYRPIVYWLDEEQRAAAEASRAALQRSGRFGAPVVTAVARAESFHPAEEYHQDYAEKNAARYELYRAHSGRDGLVARVWGVEALMDPAAPPSARGAPYRKPSAVELQKQLSATQFEVTQRDGTEPPFDNEYWHNEREGIYVDVVSGEPLFSSRDKFDSGTGWPSFTRPLAPSNIVLKTDRAFGMVRVEVRSRYADSHLGHVFDDGPGPTGLRSCMDSAALRFVAVENLAQEGYGQYLRLFQK